MDRVKGNIVWWNKQLKELRVDQAALISEPDPLTIRSGIGFHDIYGSPEGLVPC